MPNSDFAEDPLCAYSQQINKVVSCILGTEKCSPEDAVEEFNKAVGEGDCDACGEVAKEVNKALKSLDPNDGESVSKTVKALKFWSEAFCPVDLDAG